MSTATLAPINLAHLPEWAATLAATILVTCDAGSPVGWRATTTTGPTCTAGCLAPGSSAHSHTTITGYRFYGTKAFIEVDLDGNGVRIATIHPFPTS